MSLIKDLRALMPQRVLTPDEALWVAEHQANRLRGLTGYLEEPFLARDVVAGLRKVSVVYDATLPQSGSSHWTGRVWQITLNAGEPFTRQRYTLAHEFKHILDAPFDEFCYANRPRGQSPGQWAETVCDYFAATLLMPKLLVRRAFTSGGHFQDPAELARLFGVSPKAMEIRLQALGLVERRYRCRHPAAATLSRARTFYRTAAATRELLPVMPALGGVRT